MIDKKVSEALKRMNLFCTVVIVLGHSYNLTNFSTQNNVISFIEYFISYAIGGVGVPYFLYCNECVRDWCIGNEGI